MDRCLTETLIKQIPIGQKSDRTFSRAAYLAVCDEMYGQLGESLTVSHLKNRLKTLKKDLAVFHDMEISSGEFSFNRVTGGMDAKPSVWDMHIKAHPDAKQYRYKAVPTYENLCIIFGKERPARKHADEKCYPHWDLMDKGLYEKQGNHYPLEETVMEIYEESGGESMNASSMSKQAHNDPLSISIQKAISKQNIGTILDLKEIGEDQVEEESSTKKYVVWTTEMDRCLTDALVEQMQRGQKINRAFSRTAYLTVCDAMYLQLGKNLTESHLKNRLKTLKKDFEVFQDMEISSSGFSFNKVTGNMDAKPSVWDMYIKAHPIARQYRSKPVPTFENLCILFREDRSTSPSPKTGKRKHTEERCYRNLGDVEKAHDEKGSNHDPLEEIVVEINEESGGESMNTSGMSKQACDGLLSKPIPKLTSRKKLGSINDLKEEFRMFKSGLDAVASSIERCAPRIITEEKLFEEVRKIEGLNLDFQLLAYDYLCQDTIRGRTFVGLPVAFRKRWLELKLDQHTE